MACTPKLEQPQVDGNDIIFRGTCEGACKENPGGQCGAVFSLTNDGKKNKGAKVTASGTGLGQAFMRVTADKDIDDGVIVLRCACGDQNHDVSYNFTLEHRTTVEDVLLIIITLGGKAIAKLW